MPDPTQSEVHPIIQRILDTMQVRRVRDPRMFVYEYTANVKPGQAYVMDRKAFDDGRYRVFIHPDHKEALESALAVWTPDGVSRV